MLLLLYLILAIAVYLVSGLQPEFPQFSLPQYGESSLTYARAFGCIALCIKVLRPNDWIGCLVKPSSNCVAIMSTRKLSADDASMVEVKETGVHLEESKDDISVPDPDVGKSAEERRSLVSFTSSML